MAIPQDFLSPVSGIWPSATRLARGTVASLVVESQLRVPMVSRAWCGLLCPAVLVPQTRHCPQSSQLSQCVGRGLASTHPPTIHTDSPLSQCKDLGAWPKPGWLAGRWPGSGTEIKCQPGGRMAQERLQCQPNRSSGSQLSWATGPEQAPGSQDCKQDTSSMGEGYSAPFPQSPGL